MNSDRMNIDDALYQRIQDDLVDSFDEELEMEVDDQVLDAKSPEAYTAKIDRSRGEGGKVHIELTGRWLDAKCAPDDED